MRQTRPLRADAARNRAKILEAANDQIVARGPEVPMEAIAAAAGVAVGTLYRHFPTKDDLVRAVLESHLAQMRVEADAAAARIEAGANAIGELGAFARRVMDTAAGNKAVKAAARALGTEYDAGAHKEIGQVALKRLIAAGRAAGEFRDDLTVDDFFLFFTTVPIDQPAPQRERWLTLMLDGFRPAAGSR
ncbi:TetR/AcrR family transcriptional regulator [Glycomyces halotolerans]